MITPRVIDSSSAAAAAAPRREAVLLAFRRPQAAPAFHGRLHGCPRGELIRDVNAPLALHTEGMRSQSWRPTSLAARDRRHHAARRAGLLHRDETLAGAPLAGNSPHFLCNRVLRKPTVLAPPGLFSSSPVSKLCRFKSAAACSPKRTKPASKISASLAAAPPLHIPAAR
ncbi:hypothetical protein P154DRAFT_573276 [Amniculicola lignicola CBS 123094]|uniref:Uncharacterized protein n=1 Tax=Amniculicola lignicola CBS 123094 TaxID=1392246 RepID=A0A6A5WSW5_9PLEO|nr:hypothetical protein P154DRAFT_573276 [Amniculicola lignicola CBS 123094]